MFVIHFETNIFLVPIFFRGYFIVHIIVRRIDYALCIINYLDIYLNILL